MISSVRIDLSARKLRAFVVDTGIMYRYVTPG